MFFNSQSDAGDFSLSFDHQSFRFYNYTNLSVLISIYNYILKFNSRNIDENFENFMMGVSLDVMFKEFIQFKRLFYTYVRVRFPFIEKIVFSYVDKPIEAGRPIYVMLRNNTLFVIYCQKYMEQLINKVVAYNFLYNNLKTNIYEANSSPSDYADALDNNEIYELYKTIDAVTYQLDTDCMQNMYGRGGGGGEGNTTRIKIMGEPDPHLNYSETPKAAHTLFPCFPQRFNKFNEPAEDCTFNSSQLNTASIFSEKNYPKLLFLNIFNQILDKSCASILSLISEQPITNHKIHLKFNTAARKADEENKNDPTKSSDAINSSSSTGIGCAKNSHVQFVHPLVNDKYVSSQ